MSEQTPKNNSEYLEHHPDAEQNPDRAYEMARSSKDIEQEGVHLREGMAELAIRIAEMDESERETSPLSFIYKQLEDGEAHVRSRADAVAEEAGIWYDFDQFQDEVMDNGAIPLNLRAEGFTRAFGEAPIYRKSAVVKARPAEVGEVIITVTPDGVEEGRNTAGEGDYVVTGANGADFILPAEKFNKLYEANGEDGMFQSRGMARIIDNPYSKYGRKIGTLAPWGEMQYGDSDSKLAVQYDPEHPDVVGTDRYILDKTEFGAYKELESAV